jgi:hypothetical protein
LRAVNFDNQDPSGRADILLSRMFDQVMKNRCKDPALMAWYGRFKPGIDALLNLVLGPVPLAPSKRENPAPRRRSRKAKRAKVFEMGLGS